MLARLKGVFSLRHAHLYIKDFRDDETEQLLTGIEESSLELIEELNEEYSIKFQVTRIPKTEQSAGNESAFALVTYENIVTLPTNEQQYRIKEMRPIPVKGDRYVIEVEAEHIFFDLIDDKLDKADVINGSRPFVDMLNYVINGSGWRYDLKGTFYALEYENFGGENRLKLFQNLANRHGFEWFPDSRGKVVYISPRIGGESDAFIRVNHNMSNIRVTGSTRKLSTIIKCYGALKEFEDGEEPDVPKDSDYIAVGTYRSPLADYWGERWAADMEDERFKDRVELLAEGRRRIIDNVEMTFEVDYLELQRNGNNLHEIVLGNDITVIHEGIEVDSVARVTKRVSFPFSNKTSNITVGYVRNNITRQTSSAEQSARNASSSASKATRAAKMAERMAKKLNGGVEESFNFALQAVALATSASRDATNASGTAGEALRTAREASSAAQEAKTIASDKSRLRGLFVATGTQRSFTLPFQYTPGRNQLDVYVGYTKRISGTPANALPSGFTADYTEPNGTTITFLDPPPAGAPVEIIARG